MSAPPINDQTTADTEDDDWEWEEEPVRAIDDPVVRAEIARVFRAVLARRAARLAREARQAVEPAA